MKNGYDFTGEYPDDEITVIVPDKTDIEIDNPIIEGNIFKPLLDLKPVSLIVIIDIQNAPNWPGYNLNGNLIRYVETYSILADNIRNLLNPQGTLLINDTMHAIEPLLELLIGENEDFFIADMSILETGTESKGTVWEIAMSRSCCSC